MEFSWFFRCTRKSFGGHTVFLARVVEIRPPPPPGRSRRVALERARARVEFHSAPEQLRRQDVVLRRQALEQRVPSIGLALCLQVVHLPVTHARLLALGRLYLERHDDLLRDVVLNSEEVFYRRS